MLRQSGTLLAAGAPLILYGPYFGHGAEPAPSNLAFDADLRRRDPRWGLRQLEEVVALAEKERLLLEAVHAMPANNVMIILRRA